MGFSVSFEQAQQHACVYCLSYRPLLAFMDTDVNWFDALQLQVSLANIDCRAKMN